MPKIITAWNFVDVLLHTFPLIIICPFMSKVCLSERLYHTYIESEEWPGYCVIAIFLQIELLMFCQLTLALQQYRHFHQRQEERNVRTSTYFARHDINHRIVTDILDKGSQLQRNL